MKEIRVIEPKPQVSLEEIDRFEQKTEIILPKDYRTFLLQHNGGHPVEDCFKFFESNDKKKPTIACVSWFCAIYDGMVSNLYNTFLTFRGRVPDEFLPIARDGLGNLICLCVKGENYGKVYFWDHELEAAEGEAPTYDNISFISNSFTAFINSLHEYEEEEPER